MTGSITRRSGTDRKGRWQIRVPGGRDADGRPVQVSTMFEGSRREAITAKEKFAVKVAESRAGGERMRLSDLLNRFLEDREARGREDITLAHYRTYVAAWTAALGDKAIGVITPEDLEAFYRGLKGRGGEPASPATVAKYHATIRAAYNMAIARRWLMHNPAPATARPTLRRAKIDVPSPAEVRRLRECAPGVGPQIDAFLTLAVDTWARRSEVAALRRSHVNLERAEVLIEHALTPLAAVKATKTHARRLLSIAGSTCDKLADYYEAQEKDAADKGFRWAEDAFLFSADPEGRMPARADLASSDFAKVRAAAGVNVRLGSLRHFGPTQALQHGMNIVAVSHRLGHRLVSTTLDHYAEFIPSTDQALSELMGSLMDSPDVPELLAGPSGLEEGEHDG